MTDDELYFEIVERDRKTDAAVFDRLVVRCGISNPDFAPVNVRAISREVGASYGLTRASIRRLEAAGYVERRQPGFDKRAHRNEMKIIRESNNLAIFEFES